MLASIQRTDAGYIVRFDRHLQHAVEKVWAAITDNDKLAKWMPNLQINDLRSGGLIKFDMKDGSGTFIDMEILECIPYSVLEFVWGTDRVRFELYPEPEGCLLVLKEYIGALSDHTSKDLSGWHVCLDMMSALLQGQPMAFPKSDWEKWHARYKEEVDRFQQEG
ncbi:SRPBCC family protein [Paenibacillus aestuarii]|uniref:SRPBCC family protein n=1 Tax=Paenibacillus aestuarii TaxID=516965 RepID=A0ABW0K5R3_9BACL|nr:SRPBCC family protein [Paenibacillus aestuarii]